jgi:hypothetical protein
MGRFDFKTRTGQISAIIQSITFDEDAQEFFNRVAVAGGTLTIIEQEAIDTLVVQMKANNIWNSMKAIYPMVGASAAACAQNLKSSSFTGTFTSGWTFASNGITPNGTSAYMDTALNASTNITNNNNHISIYSRTNSNGVFADIGLSANGPSFIPLNVLYTRDSNSFVSRAYDYTIGKTLSITNLNSQGFFVTNRTSNVVLNGWKNGNKEGTATYTNTDNIATVNRTYYLGAANLGGTASQFANRQYAFASIGDGLTDTQALNFYISVQAFNTSLNREV